MAKKGIVATVVQTAVAAAEKALSPSPLAKHVIAAAAAGAAAELERRATALAQPVEAKLKRNVIDPATKQIDDALGPDRTKTGRAKPAPRSKQAARAKTATRKTAGSRKKAKQAIGARTAGAARKPAAKRKRGAVHKKTAKAKRR